MVTFTNHSEELFTTTGGSRDQSMNHIHANVSDKRVRKGRIEKYLIIHSLLFMPNILSAPSVGSVEN